MSNEEGSVGAVWTTGQEYEWRAHGNAKKRLDSDLAYAIKSESHYWIALAMYHLTDDSLKNLKTEQVHMDMENLMEVNMGCYLCEEPYSDRVSKRRCKGQSPGNLEYVRS